MCGIKLVLGGSSIVFLMLDDIDHHMQNTTLHPAATDFLITTLYKKRKPNIKRK